MTEAQLRAFVAVAESGSFKEAARHLHMSQPGVSRALSALELELGGALVVRGHGRVSLTAFWRARARAQPRAAARSRGDAPRP
ncbi:MAG: LysR family transcriptional regulator [Solirubrobacteraceae bacterium]